MKKILFLLSIAIIAVSCGKEGETGPQGPQGPGATFEEAQYSFTASNGSAIHDPTIISSLENVSVLTYLNGGGDSWALMPFRMSNTNENTVFFHSSNDDVFVYLRTDDVDGNDYPWTSETQFKFRFVYIPFSGIRKHVDVNNYDEVEAAYLTK